MILRQNEAFLYRTISMTHQRKCDDAKLILEHSNYLIVTSWNARARCAVAYRACARYRLFGAKFKPQGRSQMATHCPMFTERHIHHSAVWIIEGFSVSSFCLACATERLEHKSIVPLHCRQVLNEFQALLSAQNKPLIHILSSDRRVLDHFSTLVFGMFNFV